jgi:hypothetical protein
VIAYLSSFTIFSLGIKKILGDRYMNKKEKDGSTSSA